MNLSNGAVAVSYPTDLHEIVLAVSFRVKSNTNFNFTHLNS